MHTIEQRAEAAVGPDEPREDWQLRPAGHALALPPQAGALKRVLESAAVREIMTSYEMDDAAAVAAQAKYKRAGHLGLKLATASAIIGALFLLPFDVWFGDALRSFALAAQFIALAGAVAASRYLMWKQPFDAWMKARGRAEIARVKLFDTVVSAQEPVQPGELPLLPLQLEYFRRYQLSVQRNYYFGQGGKHARAAGATSGWKLLSTLVAIAASCIVIAGVIDLIAATGVPAPWIDALAQALRALRPPWSDRALLAAGIVSSALFSFASSRSLMNLDERNASRYLTNAQNLEYLTQTGLQAARTAAAQDDAPAVQAFVQSVHNLVSSEHKEWVLLREIAPKPDPRHAQLPRQA